MLVSGIWNVMTSRAMLVQPEKKSWLDENIAKLNFQENWKESNPQYGHQGGPCLVEKDAKVHFLTNSPFDGTENQVPAKVPCRRLVTKIVFRCTEPLEQKTPIRGQNITSTRRALRRRSAWKGCSPILERVHCHYNHRDQTSQKIQNLVVVAHDNATVFIPEWGHSEGFLG